MGYSLLFSGSSNPAMNRTSSVARRPASRFVMIEPYCPHEPKISAVFSKLEAAIIKAGGEVYIPARAPRKFYATDYFFAIGDIAIYLPGDSDNVKVRDLLGSAVKAAGYKIHALKHDSSIPEDMFEGGNLIDDVERNLVFLGVDHDHNDGILTAVDKKVQEVQALTGRQFILVGNAHRHLDSVMGRLPNGKFLVKLDETKRDYAGGKYNLLLGVTDKGMQALCNTIDRKNLITFSFGRTDTDFTLGLDKLSDRKSGFPLSMLTNFTVVGSTIVGEDFPVDVRSEIEKEGMTFISPMDVGVQSFLLGESGFVGGARCASLSLPHAAASADLQMHYAIGLTK
jgi:hypothetical protein